MAKDNSNYIELEGVVDRQIHGKFIVIVETQGNKMEIVCTLSGKVRMNNIKILLGDKVIIRVSVYDLTKGIIIWRA